MVDGEEQIFDPKHPIWKIILVLVLGLLAIGGVGTSDLLAGVL
jgi:hypothetical protein